MSLRIAIALLIAPLIPAVVLTSPAVAQGNGGGNNGNGFGNGGGNGSNGQGDGGGQYHNAPLPVLAGGVPGLLVLGGAYVVARRRRKKP